MEITADMLRMNMLVQKGHDLYKVSSVYTNRFTVQLVLFRTEDNEYATPPRTTVQSFPFTDIPKFKDASAQLVHRYEDAYGLGTPAFDRK